MPAVQLRAGSVDQQPMALPRLLVTLPALDEERTVAEVVRGVPRQIPGVGHVEVVVVDDGSRDRTAERAREAGAEVIRHERPRGVGAAFHSGLALGIERGADLIVSIDADGQFDPADIPRLVEPVVAGRADFASASRFLDPSLAPEMPAIKRWGNRMMSRLISRLAGQRFHDVSCGMRCYSRVAALQLHLLGRFTYTQEVFLNLAFKQLRIAEVPIRVRGEREFGESRVAGNLWRYALRSAQIIFRCYRDYHPLRFFGGIALCLCVPAVGLGGFLLLH
jgi:glycosyltransferase involved in cell wall biosynthesis